MRISTSYQFDSVSKRIQEAQQRYLDAQQRVMTGKRVVTVSDDPFGSSVILNARRMQSQVEQFGTNLRSAKDYLGTSEQAFEQINTLTQRAYELTVSAANSTTSPDARANMAREISSIQERLIQLGNSQGIAQQYVFAGQSSTTPPFTLSGTTLNFQGDANDVRVEVGPSELMKVNSTVGSMITTLYQRLQETKVRMESGDLSSLSNISLQDLKNSQDALRLERGQTGIQLQRIQALEAHHARQKEDLTKRISDVEDVDMGEAIMQLKLNETVYQAALQVGAMNDRLSLLDYIRG
ncbi:MAG TPA: flagellar hook-associated protein FlgL [Fimbriimonadaceae bacterium]|nr:flagellar hook-associated protein FlgL [Fimbriimonadaceae bacterium]HRJ32511.1 flagellar hook-associated protein FlgL [Fimbriimonadaceae bacterium]